MSKKSLIIALLYLLLSGKSNADMHISHQFRGSTFYIDAVNTDNIGYHCTTNYTIFYKQYGDDGKQIFTAQYNVEALRHGTVYYNSTTWDHNYLDYHINSEQCTNNPSVPVTSPPAKFNCPDGLTYIGSDHGEANQGGRAFFGLGKVTIPDTFAIDESYHQTRPTKAADGGARSPWDGLSGIPPGINISTDGGHYWSVGIPITDKSKDILGVSLNGGDDNGLPKIITNHDGKRAVTLGMYCGPEGRPGPGCNVNMYVCAKKLR